MQELCGSIVWKRALSVVVLGREGAQQEMVVAGDMADVVEASDWECSGALEGGEIEHMADIASIGVAQEGYDIEVEVVVGSSWRHKAACIADYTSVEGIAGADEGADADADCIVSSSLLLASCLALPADDGHCSSCRLGSFLLPIRPRLRRSGDARCKSSREEADTVCHTSRISSAWRIRSQISGRRMVEDSGGRCGGLSSVA